MRRLCPIALALVLTAPAVLAQPCTTPQVSYTIGPLSNDRNISYGVVVPATFIDVSEPATVPLTARDAIFSMIFFDANPVTVSFSSVYASGTTYTTRSTTTPAQVTRQNPGPGASPETHTMTLNPPLTFQPGDMLAVTFTSPVNGQVAIATGSSDNPNGILSGLADITAGPLQYGSRLIPNRYMSFFASAGAQADCKSLPAPEIFFPVVGDVTGLAHYTTDVRVMGFLYHDDFVPGSPAPHDLNLAWTLRDRTKGAVQVSQGTSVAPVQTGSAFTLGSIAPATSPYLGSLTVSLPDFAQVFQQKKPGAVLQDVAASARIAANTANGESGSTVPAVSCTQIGHEIALPFHVPPNHRLNIGIASAQLNSCGIFKPATAVQVRVQVPSGTILTIPMPGESIQLNDVTGPASPLPDAIGLTDGIIGIQVTDEASRIVAYTSVLDNVSQSSNITLGLVTR